MDRDDVLIYEAYNIQNDINKQLKLFRDNLLKETEYLYHATKSKFISNIQKFGLTNEFNYFSPYLDDSGVYGKISIKVLTKGIIDRTFPDPEYGYHYCMQWKDLRNDPEKVLGWLKEYSKNQTSGLVVEGKIGPEFISF